MSNKNAANTRAAIDAAVEALHWFADAADAQRPADFTSAWRHAEAEAGAESALAGLSVIAPRHPALRPLAGRIEVVRQALGQAIGKPGRYPLDQEDAGDTPSMTLDDQRRLNQHQSEQRVAATLSEYRERCQSAERLGQPPPLIGGNEQITKRYDRLPEQARSLADDLSAVAALSPAASVAGRKRGRRAIDPEGTRKLVEAWNMYIRGEPGAKRADFVREVRPDTTVDQLKRAQARVRKVRGKSRID